MVALARDPDAEAEAMTSLATVRRASAVRKQHKSVLVCKPTSAAKAKAVVATAQKDHVAKVGGAVTRVHAARAGATPSATASPHAKARRNHGPGDLQRHGERSPRGACDSG
jgi:hypothetical protein